jgi:hypothetical protein
MGADNRTEHPHCHECRRRERRNQLTLTFNLTDTRPKNSRKGKEKFSFSDRSSYFLPPTPHAKKRASNSWKSDIVFLELQTKRFGGLTYE